VTSETVQRVTRQSVSFLMTCESIEVDLEVCPLNANFGFLFCKALSNMILIDDQLDSSVSSLSNVIFPFFTSYRTYLLNALHLFIG